ncbi:MAG: GNAT family N-acetyltransferase [Candidatus Marinimicrobia bacterium]|nr:GNAT family N-acetyltransferase [Candidatus Neomarinimicrobiota bacterium]MBL7023144.1 GNAT family N-acetyltransferase [Candidatus Neomarinimicrobiota bacterium]MBL7109048.1 GNAT family N-acetyltransferase [Candidatus Neomarinimicrobiota bacterium]
MGISVRKYQHFDKNIWDLFVNQSNNGTLFHLRDFLNYHIGREFIDHSLIFEKNGTIIAVFSASEIFQNNRKILYSHPGASFGGFVINKISYQIADEIIKLTTEYCKQNNFDEMFFVPTPRIYYKDYCETFDYALHWNNFETAEYYISSAIKTAGSLEDTLQQVQKRKQRYIKNTLSNQDFRFEWNKNYEEYYPILMENKSRHGVKPTHTLEELKKLDSLFPDKFHLLIMYYKNKPVGGTLNFVANSKTAVIFYNMIDYKYESFQPAALQIYETIRWANQSGFEYLDFGVSQNPKAENPLSPSPSLIRFKEQFGSKGMIRKAMRKSF